MTLSLSTGRDAAGTPEGSEKAPPSAHLSIVLIAIAFVARIPMLTLTGAYADDWTWVYLIKFAGPGALMQALADAAHPLYGPWLAAFLSLGDLGPLLSRWGSVVLLVANGILLFRVLSVPRLTRPIAALSAAIFLVSPFYTARGMFAHDQYDAFLTAWLLSCLWMQKRGLRWIAPFAAAFGFGVEPVMMLEPLRLLYAWKTGDSLLGLVRKVLPFWAAAIIMTILRFTLYSPRGHYAGYRPLTTNPISILKLLVSSLDHFVEAMKAAFRNAIDLLPYWQLGVLVVVAALVYFLCYRTPTRVRGTKLLVIPFGIGLLLLAALPYAVIGEYLWPYRFESRFAFVPQIGAAIALAGIIQALSIDSARKVAAFAMIAVSTLSVMGDGKWLWLDQSIQRNLQRELRAEVTAHPGSVLLVSTDPPMNQVLFRYRCLGANDLNVPLAVALGNPPPSFVYSTQCGDLPMLKTRCSVSYLDSQSCPAKRINYVYRLEAAHSTIETTTLWDALRLTGNRPEGTLAPAPNQDATAEH